MRGGTVLRTAGPFRNKVVSSNGYGRNLLLRALTGDATYPPVLTSASIGTGTATPSDSDTDLATPAVTGLTITNFAISNNVLTVEVFVPASSLLNGTYKEFGLCAGSQLFSRVLIAPNYTKATGEDSLFTYTLTLNG